MLIALTSRGETGGADTSQDDRLARHAIAAYIPVMLCKPLELPPEVAKAFVRDMKLFFKATGHEADEIAAKQAWLLKNHLPRGAKLRIADIKELFHQMRDHV